MPQLNDFFSSKNSIDKLADTELSNVNNYLKGIKAFARTTYQSVYVIDYQTRSFEFVSDNPLFLCGHTANKVQEMGYAFYFKYVIPSDLDLLLKINTIGFEFYDRLPIEDRELYSISYDFHLKNQNGNVILINQKLTPVILNSEGKIWKALCIVSLSSEQQAGNIRIFKHGENVFSEYDLEGGFWKKAEKIILSDREKEIMHFSTTGLTITEIAEKLFISPDTVKFHRRKLFEKLNVSNIAEAIAYVTSNKLI